MERQDNNRPRQTAGKGSLDGLAQRLGALEESLTVVAGELGVSSLPQFKRLDPQAVYQEAIRRAQEAIAPQQALMHALEARLEKTAQAQLELTATLGTIGERQSRDHNVAAALDDKLAELNARLDAAIVPFDRSDRKLDELHDSIARLSLRLDTLWERLDAEAREKNNRKLQETAEVALSQRLAALESRVENLANAIATTAGPDAAPQAVDLERKLMFLHGEMAAQLEKHLAGADKANEAKAGDAIATEVARQIAALARDATAPSGSAALLPGDSAREKAVEMNPLLMNAAERAIVRLTRRLEKLEDWRRQRTAEAKPGRGLMGRLFET
jgi:DNA repair exonuclease SbcCD ATPase subunit